LNVRISPPFFSPFKTSSQDGSISLCVCVCDEKKKKEKRREGYGSRLGFSFLRLGLVSFSPVCLCLELFSIYVL